MRAPGLTNGMWFLYSRDLGVKLSMYFCKDNDTGIVPLLKKVNKDFYQARKVEIILMSDLAGHQALVVGTTGGK